MVARPVGGDSETSFGLVRSGWDQVQTVSLHGDEMPSCIPSWLPSSHPAAVAKTPTCESLAEVLPAKRGKPGSVQKRKLWPSQRRTRQNQYDLCGLRTTIP